MPRPDLFCQNQDTILFYHDFLCLHIVAINEAQHVNARRHPVGRDVARRVSTSGFAPGVYVLRLIQGDKARTQKIVIN